jgi:hypothetical protein
VLDSEAKGTHVFPLQHPLGHEVASQTHWPVPLQCWPVAQAAQAVPPLPHEVFDSPENGSQVVPLQQPAHELVPPHEHAPALHVSPEPQAAHATPPTPQRAEDCKDGRTHVLPLQHPVGHDDWSHVHWPVLLLHSCPVLHALHAIPPLPQEPFVSDAYGTQVLP